MKIKILFSKLLNNVKPPADRLPTSLMNIPAADSGISLVDQQARPPPPDLVVPSEKPDQLPPSARQQWDNPVEFLLSCISMSVGLGNVWRFPFTAYENGGGAFLIPYFLVLMLVGRPLYLLELSLGQFSSGGCVKIWDLCPPFRGIGYGQSFGTFVVTSYYCVLIAISFYYLFASFQSVLPWTVCHATLQENSTVCLPSNHSVSMLNLTDSSSNLTVISSTEQYFRRGVLKEKLDISDGIGLPDPALLGCLVLCWILLYFSLRKGVSSSGKVAYFTSIFPYTVMIALMIRGLTLPGSLQGVVFLIKPQWHKLYDVKVWYAAVTQAFFSLGIGFGCLATFGSFNKFSHNIYRDATIISVADTFTSSLAGVITFSILGHLAYELELPIEKVVKSGAGLAFISYPEVVSKFDFSPQLFAVLFFMMLITLGFGSAIGMVNAVITIICDNCSQLSRQLVTMVVCLTGLAVGVIFTTPGGQAMLELIDYYGGSLLILSMAVAEITVVAWIYRTSNLITDLNFMMQRNLGLFWRLCWTYLIPVSLSLILAYTLVFYQPVQYAQVDLPVSAQVGGWMLALTGPLITLVFLVVSVSRLDGWGNSFTTVFRPKVTWGPKNVVDRLDWMTVKNAVKENSST